MTSKEQIQQCMVEGLLNDGNKYIIPMYQRNYAWGEAEITQLIKDVADYQEKDPAKPYYIGTLVVYKRNDGSFEIIDGQQRFTTLVLLALLLKQKDKNNGKIQLLEQEKIHNLEFESRPKSTNTLYELSQGNAIHELKNDLYNQDLLSGWSELDRALKTVDKLDEFIEYLANQVKIIRIELPKDVDLNHYFEVMNNRGEQLEKHEVLKAKLISYLNDADGTKSEKENNILAFTKIWNATANMERYIQYGFTPEERCKVFGSSWDSFSLKSFDKIVEVLYPQQSENNTASGHSQPAKSTKLVSNGLTIMEMLNTASSKNNNENEKEERPDRFNSVVNFQNFLLHVLRVWQKADIPLDDKRLLDIFDVKIENADQVKKFAFTLLKAKFLFDQYIIKREFLSNEEKWSLMRLKYDDKKSASYVNSFSKDNSDTEVQGEHDKNKQILMLLSAFHVSAPTQGYKYWLNGALNILYEYKEQIIAEDYLAKLEKMARNFVYGRFLGQSEKNEYHDIIYDSEFSYTPLEENNKQELSKHLKYGAIQNNFIFNYLDYLLWVTNKDPDSVYKNFEFTFRSSVEHFYPQHPMNDDKVLTDEAGLHSFGNLCLISHSKNSRLSNYPPSAKKEHFQPAINEGKIDSLKIYEMINLLNNEDSWGEKQIKKHELEMLQLFIVDSKKQDYT